MNLEPALKNEQNRLKHEIKLLDNKIEKIVSDSYKEKRWRLRDDRPVGVDDKRRLKEIETRRNILQTKRKIIQIEVWFIGDAICRLREIKRGNSKRCVGSVFKQLITGSK